MLKNNSMTGIVECIMEYIQKIMEKHPTVLNVVCVKKYAHNIYQ